MRHYLILLILSSLLFAAPLSAQLAPDFHFVDIEGNRHQLYHALDQNYVVLLTLFFVDCEPCREALPELRSIYQDYSDDNLLVWSLSDRDPDSLLRQYAEQAQAPFILSGTDGMAEEAIDLLTDNFPFFGFPTIAVICPDRSINWDIWPYSPGAPEWRQPIEFCGLEESLPPYQPLEPSNTSQLQVQTGASLHLFPNPVHYNTQLCLKLKERQNAALQLIRADGSLVATLHQGALPSGEHFFHPLQSVRQAGWYVLRYQSARESIHHTLYYKGY